MESGEAKGEPSGKGHESGLAEKVSSASHNHGQASGQHGNDSQGIGHVKAQGRNQSPSSSAHGKANAKGKGGSEANGTQSENPNSEKHEKSKLELFRETTSELADPNAWIRYASEILSEFFKPSKPSAVGVAAFDDDSLYSYNAKVLVLAIIALLVVIWFFFVQ